jgi:hypothetical protein
MTTKTPSTNTSNSKRTSFSSKINTLFEETNSQFDKMSSLTVPKSIETSSQYGKEYEKDVMTDNASVATLLTALQSTLYHFQYETSTALATMHTHVNKSQTILSSVLNSSIEEVYSHIEASLQRQRMLDHEWKMKNDNDMKMKMEEYENRIRRLETIIEQQSHMSFNQGCPQKSREEEELDDIDFIDPDEEDSSSSYTKNIPKLSQTVPPISFSALRDQMDAKLATASGRNEEKQYHEQPSSSRKTTKNIDSNEKMNDKPILSSITKEEA